MHLKSIQLKIAILAGIFLVITAGILVVFGLISSDKTRTFISQNVDSLSQKNAQKLLGTLAQAQAAIIQSHLQDNLDTARTMAKVFEVVRTHEKTHAEKEGRENTFRELVNSVLINVVKSNPNYLGAYSAWEPNAPDGNDADFAGKSKSGHDPDGRLLAYWNRGKDGNMAVQVLVGSDNADVFFNGVPKGGCYLGPKNTGRELVLDPIPYEVQGQQEWLTTICAPIQEDGKFLGVAGTDLRNTFMQELSVRVDNDLYEGKGDVLVISYQGIIVASSKYPKDIGQPLKSLFPSTWQDIISMVQSGKSLVDTNQDGTLMRAFAPVHLGRTEKPWSILIRVPPEVVMAESRALEAAMDARSKETGYWQMGTGAVVTLLAMIFIWFFSGTLVRPLRAAAGYAEKVAQGDFSQQLDIKQEDEIGTLATALKTMVGNLEEMISQAEEKSQEAAREAEQARKAMDEAEKARAAAAQASRQGMLEAAQKLEAVVERVTSASEELSTQVEQSRNGAELQRKHSGESAESMEEMNSAVLEVAQRASETAASSDNAKSKAQEGSEVVHQVVDAINMVQNQTESLKKNMNTLGSQAQEIGQIINVITDIADQTNLLALNAAIEAARAGEAGRGFAVVADEVRKLAEKTMSATTEVSQAIQAIQAGASTSLEGMDKAAEAVNQATGLAERSGTVLEEIVRIVETSADQVRTIASASEQQSEASEKMTKAIDEINIISVDTAEAMAQSSLAFVELSEQAQTLQTLINELKGM